MTTHPDMRVLLRELPRSSEITLPASFVAQAIAGMPLREALERDDNDPDAGEARFAAELHSDDQAHVFVRGRMSGWLAVACSRCVEPVRAAIDEDIAVTYIPAAQVPATMDGEDPDDEDGVELGTDDLDVFPYDGESIDLEPLLREQVILAVPFAPLCSESCKGLCPQCGANRNASQCACEPPIDPRLSTLTNIKL
jgi:uncharacterized protein